MLNNSHSLFHLAFNCLLFIGLGKVVTLAGKRIELGEGPYAIQDGMGSNAILSYPISLTVDTNTSALYIVDTYNYAIRKIKSMIEYVKYVNTSITIVISIFCIVL